MVCLPKPEIPQAKRDRRALRQDKIYDRIGEALLSVSKRAQAFDVRAPERTDRKIESGVHPGDAAVSMVHGLLAEFSLPAQLRLRYAGIDRKAGVGGHGISEGVIFVDAEMKPAKGMTAYFSIPVIVRNARMQYPVVITTQEGPRIIAQSTFDDLLGRAEVDQQDVLAAHSPPVRLHASRDAVHRPTDYMTKNEQEQLKGKLESSGKSKEEQEAEKAKERRKRRQQEREQIRSAIRGWK